MSNLINIFLDPGKVFADLKDKPSFWLPFLALVIVNTLMVLSYFMTVDPSWFTDHQLMLSGREMSAAELEQAKQFMPGARTTGYIAAVASPIVMLIMFSISALYLMLAGKITGQAITFKKGFSLTAWASMPVLLGALVALVGVFTMTSQTALESLMLTHFDPLVVQLPFDHAASGVAKAFDLLQLWVIFLTAMGWRIWGRTSWAQALIVAAIPSVLIFGGWAAFALLK